MDLSTRCAPAKLEGKKGRMASNGGETHHGPDTDCTPVASPSLSLAYRHIQSSGAACDGVAVLGVFVFLFHLNWSEKARLIFAHNLGPLSGYRIFPTTGLPRSARGPSVTCILVYARAPRWR